MPKTLKITHPAPATFEVQIALRVSVAGVDLSNTDHLSKELNDRLSSWSDGRHAFSVELLQEGMRKVMQTAVQQLLSNQAYQHYPLQKDYQKRNALRDRLQHNLIVECHSDPQLAGWRKV